MKTDFEICEICDVSITLMTSRVGDVSEKLRKNVGVLNCLHCSKYKLSFIKAIFMKFKDNIAR